MPGPRGDLPAIMAVLALLLRGPDSQANLKIRFEREFPHGDWSRSIVHSSLTSLVEQGFAALVQTGAKPSENVYEATGKGITAFREWLREIARQPPPLREPMQVWLEHSTEDELPDLLQAIREREETARAEFRAAQIHLNSERILGRLGPSDGSDWQGTVRNAVLSELVMIHGQRAVRFKKLRGRLMQGRERHSPIPPDDDG